MPLLFSSVTNESDFFSSCTLYLFLIFGLMACEILVLWPGIEPHSLHWKQGVLTNWTTRKVPRVLKLGTQVLCLVLPWNLLVIQVISSLRWLVPKCVQAMKLSSYITSARIKKGNYIRILVIYFRLANNPKMLRLETTKQNKKLLSYIFWESGIGERLRWVLLSQGLTLGCNKAIGCSPSHLKAWFLFFSLISIYLAVLGLSCSRWIL